MVELQRKISTENSVVMDGRDIGSYVLPNADVKIFLNADIKERARRRYSEQLSKNIENITLEEVLRILNIGIKMTVAEVLHHLPKPQMP